MGNLHYRPLDLSRKQRKILPISCPKIATRNVHVWDSATTYHRSTEIYFQPHTNRAPGAREFRQVSLS